MVLESFAGCMDRDDLEVLLVNNGSTDDSNEVLLKYLPDYTFARSVHVPVNRGYGYGVRAGLKEARGNFLGWTHADMQTDPSDVLRACDIIEKHDCPSHIMVKGYRVARNLPDRTFSGCMGLIESVLFGLRLTEINAQPNLFHKDFLSKWQNPPDDFSLDLYCLVLAKKLRLKIIRFDVLFPERVNGESSWNTNFKSKVVAIFRTLSFSFQLRARLRHFAGSKF